MFIADDCQCIIYTWNLILMSFLSCSCTYWRLRSRQE